MTVEDNLKNIKKMIDEILEEDQGEVWYESVEDAKLKIELALTELNDSKNEI